MKEKFDFSRARSNNYTHEVHGTHSQTTDWRVVCIFGIPSFIILLYTLFSVR